MSCRFTWFALMITVCLFSSSFRLGRLLPGKQPSTKDDSTPQQPVKKQTPDLRLHVDGRQNKGEARGFSLAVEVTNPGPQTLQYVGYRPDSFNPPIPKGRMQAHLPHRAETAGKWQTHPIGWCGTGMDDLEFAPQDLGDLRCLGPGGALGGRANRHFLASRRRR